MIGVHQAAHATTQRWSGGVLKVDYVRGTSLTLHYWR